MKVLYSGYYPDDGYPFHSLAETVVHAKYPAQMTEQDSALVIWGGADIAPKLYGHETSSRTSSGGQRDYAEWALMQHAIKMGIPIIGVCRGAQMGCAAAGGYLIQHVDNHAGYSHLVETYDGQTIKVNSIHHQMMFVPEGVDHEVLGWSKTHLSDQYIYQKDQTHPRPEKELEFIYFPKIKCFAIQWHPEGMPEDCEATQFIMKEIGIKLGHHHAYT